jgi:hypothetical protein
MNKRLSSVSAHLNISLLLSVILGIVPWISLVILLANFSTAFALIFLLMVASGLGYLPLALFGFLQNNIKLRLAFAPAIGFIFLSAYFALASRLVIPIKPVFWVFCIIGIISSYLFFRDLYSHRKDTVPMGLCLVAISVILALTFFRPSLKVNGVLHEDGRYSWIDVDTTYTMGVAVSIEMSSPPFRPGMFKADLSSYHFGSYAIAGFLSAATGLQIADSLRALHGLGLIVLFLAAIACSQNIAKVFGDRELAASFGILGLFFCLGTIELSTAIIESLAFTKEITYLIPPEISDPNTFYTAHSNLWSLIGLISVLGLLVGEWESRLEINTKLWVLGLIAAHIVPLNFYAGLGSCGILAGVCVISNMKQIKAWIYAGVIFIIMLTFFAFMGTFSSPTRSTFTLDSLFFKNFFDLYLWIYFGLGISLYAFRYVKQRSINPLSLSLILSCIGYMMIFILVKPVGSSDNRYGLVILLRLLSMMTYIAVSYPLRRLIRGDSKVLYQETVYFFIILKKLSLLFAGILFISSLILVLRNSPNGIMFFFYVLIPIFTAFLSMILLALFNKSQWFQIITYASLLLLFFLGQQLSYLGFMQYGVDESEETIYLSSGEYQGLKALKGISDENDIIATNKHDIPERPGSKKSYVYFPVLERRILLEGYNFWEDSETIFPTIKHHNDLLFSTTDPEIMKNIIDKYGIDFLVYRPETSLNVSEIPTWLKELKDMGSITVYEVIP